MSDFNCSRSEVAFEDASPFLHDHEFAISLRESDRKVKENVQSVVFLQFFRTKRNPFLLFQLFLFFSMFLFRFLRQRFVLLELCKLLLVLVDIDGGFRSLI